MRHGELTRERTRGSERVPEHVLDHLPPVAPRGGAVRAARRLNRASGMLAASVLADSAVEHYRGRYFNPAMYTPLAVSTLSILASLHGVADRRRGAHRARDATYVLAAAAGLAGTAFHLYNIGKRTGGYTWVNFFYAAPVGAPAALALSGLLGFAAERVRDNPPGVPPTIFGLPAGRSLAALTSAGLMGTVGEVGLLHFRGAFQNPGMFIPVTMPPVAAGLLARNAAAPGGRRARSLTRLWLRLTALMGFAGVGFHAYGVGRMMGGWRNWSQNAVDGPPLPAPPSFTGLALAGLAALGLLEDRADGR